MRIVPAILTNDESELNSELTRLAPHFDSFQIDVQDGIYVPNKTLSISQTIAILSQEKFRQNGFFRSILTFDVHLMLGDYQHSIKALKDMASVIGLRHIFVQENFRDEKMSKDICPSISPDVDLNKDENTISCGKRLLDYPAVQIMSVFPGPQGQGFQESALEKVYWLRRANYKGEVLIDGSINEKSLSIILNKDKGYHPDTLCIGSYFSNEKSETEIARKKELLTKMIGNS